MNWQKGTPQMGEHRGSAKMMELEARIAKLEKALNIQAGGTNIELSCLGTLKVSATTIEITGNGMAEINGGILKLNKGSRPVSGVGYITTGTPASQTITTGSPTILIP